MGHLLVGAEDPHCRLLMRVCKNEKLSTMEKVRLTRACVRKRSDAATEHL